MFRRKLIKKIIWEDFPQVEDTSFHIERIHQVPGPVNKKTHISANHCEVSEYLRQEWDPTSFHREKAHLKKQLRMVSFFSVAMLDVRTEEPCLHNSERK